jgi:uncharacterized membrane protein YbhN (UPF0104 family)
LFSLSRVVFWGLLLLATVAGALWAIAHFAGGYARFFELAAPIAPAQWLVLAAATAVFYLLDYARLYTLFRLLGIRIAPGTGAQLTCVSYFVSSLTPTAELTIPAMILLLRQKGIPASQTTAVALAKAFYVLAWVCVAGFGTLLARDDVRLPAAIAGHIFLLTAPAAILITTFFYVMFFPERVLRWKAKNRLADGIRHCAAALSQMGKSADRMHFFTHAACIAFIGAYIFIGAYLCRVLDVPVTAGKAVTAFSNSLLVSYLAPVPGAIGVTEVLTSYFLDPAMTERGMVASTLLRFLCWYVLAIPGAVLLLNAIRAAGWQQLKKPWLPDPRR